MNPTLGPATGPLADAASAHPLALPACIAGGATFIFGAWLVWGGRGTPPTPTGPWHARLSRTSRAVLGLCIMLLGYHAASWASPDHWLPFRVPLERWYLVVGGVLAAIVGSLWADRRQSAPNDR